MKTNEEILTDAYRKKFGEEPGESERMVIKVSAYRLDDDGTFKWVQSGDWRQLRFIKPNDGTLDPTKGPVHRDPETGISTIF